MQLKALYISLFAGFLISSVTLASNDTLALNFKADSLFMAGRFSQAAKYYQKASYYSVSERNKTLLLLKKVDCLKQTGDFIEAETIISELKDPGNDSLRYLINVQGALCSYLQSEYLQAEAYLVKLNYDLSDKLLQVQANVLHAMILNELSRWSEAKQKLIEFVNSGDPSLKERNLKIIDSLYSKKSIPKLKSVSKARRLSHFIPGSGQMYAGFFAEGFTSLALNTLAVAGTAVGIYFQYYFTSFVAGNYFFGKFYLGNISRAEFLAKKRNYLLTNNFNARLKPFLMDLQK